MRPGAPLIGPAQSERRVLNAPPQAMTSSSTVLTAASWWAAGLKSVKFSKSVNSDSMTWARTSATRSSAMTSRSCSTARTPPGAAVADEPGRFVVPFGVQVVDRVLERAGYAVVVLGRYEDVAVKGPDLCGPRSSVLPTVLPQRGRYRLVEKGQVEILDIDDLKLRIGAPLGDFVNPAGHGFRLATRTRAADDDGEPEHSMLPRRDVRSAVDVVPGHTFL
jgi:hypothetical protein